MKRKGNLSEELYRMRKLMNFDSEKFRDGTTSLDNLVEERMVKKYLINEQSAQEKLKQIENEKRYDDNLQKAKDSINSTGYNAFEILPDESDKELDVEDIKAFFYNNMITLEKGLMKETPLENVTQQVRDIVGKIKEEGYDESTLKINIVGTASSEPASKYADSRLGENVPVDHNWGGGNPDDEWIKSYGNDYLGKGRARSIHSLFEKALPNATYTVSSKTIPGGAGEEGDPSRYIKLNISGKKTVQDTITKSEPYLEFSFYYKEGEGYTTWEALQMRIGKELVDKQPAKTGGGPFPTFTSVLEIKFGNETVTTMKGIFLKKSMDHLCPNKQNCDDEEVVLENSWVPGEDTKQVYKMARLDKPLGNVWQQEPAPGSPYQPEDYKKLVWFLMTLGHFTNDQVKEIMLSFGDPTTLAGKLKKEKGNLNDFISAFGGLTERKLDTTYANNAWIVDRVKKRVYQLK